MSDSRPTILRAFIFVCAAGLLPGCQARTIDSSDVAPDSRPTDDTSASDTAGLDTAGDTPGDLATVSDTLAADTAVADTGSTDTADADTGSTDTQSHDTGADAPDVSGPWCASIPQPVTSDQVPEVYVRSVCEAWSRCGLAWPLLYGAQALDLETCVDLFQKRIEAVPDVSASIQFGFIQYRADKALECARELCTFRCDLLQGGEVPAACMMVYGPTLTVGSNCTNDYECASRRCDLNNACPGVCVSGTACPYVCGSAEFCNGQTGQCVPLAGESESCATVGCRAGLHCVVDVIGAPVCQPLEGLDGLCDSDLDCAPLFFCDPAQDLLRCASRLPVGARCDWHAQCADGLYCGGSPSVCTVPRYGLGAGIACSAWLDTCAWPHTCRQDPFRDAWSCQPPALPGQPCQTGLDCVGYCDTQLRSCQPLASDGSRCSEDRQCQGFCAPDGTCQSTPGAPGEACRSDWGCASQQCGEVTGVCLQSCTR